jgi:hypothetical protein
MYICRQKFTSVPDTIQQFTTILDQCRVLFLHKTRDYGTSWRIMRPATLTDQIYIKAARIRSIEEKGRQLVPDSIESDYIGIVNYCLIYMVQLQLPPDAPLELDLHTASGAYDAAITETLALLSKKNHDYGEIWRDMRSSSYLDLILVKIRRIKQIEDNAGQTLVSEGVAANLMDIINYAIFALIKIEEAKPSK